MSVRTQRLLAMFTAFAAGLVLCLGVIVFVGGRGSGTSAIQAAAIGGPFNLIDQDGQPFSDKDLKGKSFLVFFGFTHCPDVCPTALADAASALRELGADAAGVQVLFVTLDPQRDTPEVLRQYVPAFHPSFLGLYGDEAAISRVKKDFNVYSAIREGRTPETYTVDHSAQLFVFDKQGKLRLVVPPATPSRTLAADLKILLNS